VVTTLQALHFFQYRFTWEKNVFEIYSPTNVEVSSPEVQGSVSENVHGKNMAFEKHRGRVVTIPPR